MAKQKVLHHLWAINTKHMRKINQIRREIEENQMKISKDVMEKQSEIERYEFEMQRLTHKNSMELNRLMYDIYFLFFCMLKSDKNLRNSSFFILFSELIRIEQ